MSTFIEAMGRLKSAAKGDGVASAEDLRLLLVEHERLQAGYKEVSALVQDIRNEFPKEDAKAQDALLACIPSILQTMELIRDPENFGHKITLNGLVLAS